MPSQLSEEVFLQVCAEIHAETGHTAHVVDDTWSLPTWNGLLIDSPLIKPKRPSCCFQPRNSNDVAAACRVAARHGLKISARGSGHHYGGISLVEGALLLDLSALRNVQVDPSSRLARVGPAVTCRQLRAALGPHGLHFPLPHLSDVGLSGYLLGGGNGWGVRQWGAAADNVEEMEVVLLQGGGGSGSGVESESSSGCCGVVRVSNRSDRELFWGLRGGGSFLGVATEFVLRLYVVPPRLPLITATYPLRLLGQLCEFFREFHCTNPACVEASMAVVGGGEDDGGDGGGSGSGGGGLSDDGGAAVVLLSCHAFAEPGSQEIEMSYSKLRALYPDARLSLQEGPMPYEEALSVLDASWSWPGLCMYGHGVFVPVPSLRDYGGDGDNGGGGGSVAAVLAAAAASMTCRRSILLVCPSAPSIPGCAAAAAATITAAAVAPAVQTAAAAGTVGDGNVPCAARQGEVEFVPGSLSFRDTFYLGIYGMWTRSQEGAIVDGDASHVGWVRTCATALEPYTVGLYGNEVMHDERGQVRRCYDEASYRRLLALKRRVDPVGLLRSL